MAQQTVIGMFDDANQARQAAQQLESVGVTRDHIDISAQGASAEATRAQADNDGISGFFRSLFNSDDEVERYSSVARRGAMVTVHADTSQEAERARDVLDRCGAVDVDERAQQYRSGWMGAGQQSLNQQGAAAQNTTGAIPIIEEQMQVGKRVVETGGARLRSRIVERPVEEHLRLREEHVNVERVPVNRPATEADIKNFREGEMEITERAEVPVVGKEARVVEEVRLGKNVEERDETVRGTVRRTDVEVERLEGDQAFQQRRMSEEHDDTTNRGGL
ncbi:YsnF/AvaK domain-containing protein [Hymenobacter sp. 15J16-1T3B]|uniref:YsnF/AvaK domain-containing protein n=1 Tax=Hymenobacter sp. 15J16-1T3B TaxID=2886941 RepID=UPI001D1184CE|nr:YsnF/AvaK domain-containing protein [Hymenobacter sp. 15J16-1T3B]MCC3160806.1 YsnF/AvaK domain-containing protein [Hymenobacter sp. 15J16-1T3B]